MNHTIITDTMPALLVSIFHRRALAAVYVSPALAVAVPRSLSAGTVIHVDGILREEWLNQERYRALQDEFPIHPTPLETKLHALAVKHEFQRMTLEDGGLVFWDDGRDILDVCPEILRARVMEVLSIENRRAA